MTISNSDIENAIFEMSHMGSIVCSLMEDLHKEQQGHAASGSRITAAHMLKMCKAMDEDFSFAVYHLNGMIVRLREKFHGEVVA